MFSFNNISCTEYNIVVISTEGRFSLPKKQYQSIEVPGRTGNLLIDTGALLNKDITIHCYMNCAGLNEEQTILKYRELVNWLVKPTGYCELEFDGNQVFNAIVKDIVVVNRHELENQFTFDIVFECYEVIE
jgi:phage-related protein